MVSAGRGGPGASHDTRRAPPGAALPPRGVAVRGGGGSGLGRLGVGTARARAASRPRGRPARAPRAWRRRPAGAAALADGAASIAADAAPASGRATVRRRSVVAGPRHHERTGDDGGDGEPAEERAPQPAAGAAARGAAPARGQLRLEHALEPRHDRRAGRAPRRARRGARARDRAPPPTARRARACRGCRSFEGFDRIEGIGFPQRDGEQRAGPEHPGLDRTSRDAEELRRLAGAEPGDVAEHDCLAELVRQRRERALQRPPLRRSARTDRRARRGSYDAVVERLVATVAAVDDVVGGVRGDAVEPRRDACPAAEAPERAVRVQERVLQRVLGVGGVARQPQRNGVDPVAVAGDELVEGRLCRLAVRAGRAPRPFLRRPSWAESVPFGAVRTDQLDYDLPTELIAQAPGRAARCRAAAGLRPGGGSDAPPPLPRPAGRAARRRHRGRQRHPRAAGARTRAATDRRHGRGAAARAARRRHLGGAGAAAAQADARHAPGGRGRPRDRGRRAARGGAPGRAADRRRHARGGAARRGGDAAAALHPRAIGRPGALPDGLRPTAGSAAAPTAGLHFTPELLQAVRERCTVVEVDLRIGLDTFRPVVADDLDEHEMHSEAYAIDPGRPRALVAARARPAGAWSRSARRPRACWRRSPTPRRRTRAARGSRSSPAYRFRLVDALVTNFHLPRARCSRW